MNVNKVSSSRAATCSHPHRGTQGADVIGRNTKRALYSILVAVVAMGFFVAVDADTAVAASWDVTNCSACHPNKAATHTLTNCASCHGVAPGPSGDEHNDIFRGTPAGYCLQACHYTVQSTYVHGTSVDAPYFPNTPMQQYAVTPNAQTARRFACSDCHDGTYVQAYTHNQGAALEAQHVTTSTDCASCHDGQLATQHEPYSGGNSCPLCHTSTAPAVVNAISTGNTACTACHAPHGGTWGVEDYYRWGSVGRDGSVLSSIGDNPLYTSVHSGYTANTAKCGICHSVHRAAAGGSKLTKAAIATCAGCHAAGTTVTNVTVSWASGGPHGSGNAASCNSRGCHADNPHGANGSAYYAFQSKLLTRAADAVVAAAAANAGASGVTGTILDGTAANQGAVSSTRTGYTCNIPTCHGQTMLSVLQAGWTEQRQTVYLEGNTAPTIAKTGHLTSNGAVNAYSFAAVTDCESCHDQTDAGARSGFTFPHSQTAYGASNVTTSTRAWLWMTTSSNLGAPVGAVTTTGDKPKDGTCLKCHRNAANNAGIGITH